MTHPTRTDDPLALRVDLPEHVATTPDDHASGPPSHLIDDIPVTLDIHLGQARLVVKDVMALRAGSVVTLNRQIGDRIDLQLNRQTIARGEIVAVGDQFGIRITDILADPT